MKLQHYIGGLEGLGPVSLEKRVFVEPWERRVFGIHVAMMALSSHLPLPATSSGFRTTWTWADLRKGAEALNPFDYFKYRYYERWLGGISGHFVEEGYITQEELDERMKQFLEKPDLPPAKGGEPAIDARVIKYLEEGDSPRRDVQVKPRFAPGDVVLVKNVPTVNHTRLPGVPRNRIGVVDTVYEGAYTYLSSTGPDGVGEAMPVYRVQFDPKEIWPGNTEENFTLYADLYAAYLDAATH